MSEFFNFLNPRDPEGMQSRLDEVNEDARVIREQVCEAERLSTPAFDAKVSEHFPEAKWSFIQAAQGGDDDPEAWRQMVDNMTPEQYALLLADQNRRDGTAGLL
jgi:hypothetical protein